MSEGHPNCGDPNYGERFDGSDYVPAIDDARLTGQLAKVYEAMRDGEWRTLLEIRGLTGITLDASVAKHLRHLRYERFGAFQVDKRRVGDPERGLWEYRVGPKGSGHPQMTKAARRYTKLMVMATRLAGALRRRDPSHPLLAEWDAFISPEEVAA